MPLCLNKTTWQLAVSFDVTRAEAPADWYVQPDMSRVADEPDKRFWVAAADDFNGPDLMPEAARMEFRRTDKLKALATWYAESMAEGIGGGGLLLKASPADRNSFGNALAAVLNMLSLGVPDSTAFVIYDKSGTPHATTLAGFKLAMAEYTQGIVAVETQYATHYGQIAEATDKATLDAIVFGGQA
jgi:hypothetical protein